MANKRNYRIINFRMVMSTPDGKGCIDKKQLTYLEDGTVIGDFTMMFTDEPQHYEKGDKKWHENGFVKQQTNKATYEAEKALPNEQKTNMPILGNCREYIKGGVSNPANVPGGELSGVVTDAQAQAAIGNLPF